MAFNINEFEQFFNEKNLAKGLRLFEKGRVSLIEKLNNTEYYFTIDDVNTLYLNKKGDVISKHNCSCNLQSSCEHLSATVFYFQKDVLGIEVKEFKKKSIKNSAKKNTPLEKKTFKSYIQNLEISKLIDFVIIHGEENELFREILMANFMEKTEATLFVFYQTKLQVVFKSNFASGKITQKHLTDIETKLSRLISNVESESPQELFYLHLALINELPTVLEINTACNLEKFQSIYDSSVEEIKFHFKNELNDVQKKWLIYVSELSVKSNSKLTSNAYIFLVPMALVSMKNEKELIKLKANLVKRNTNWNYYQTIDKLKISKIQLQLREAELLNKPFEIENKKDELELAFAKAELHFFRNNPESAFSGLLKDYSVLKSHSYKNVLIDYIIKNAKSYLYTDIEIQFLRERLITNFSISTSDIRRFKELLTPESCELEMNTLIDDIQIRGEYFTFDKLKTILLFEKKYSELINVLKKEKNKFSLINDIAIKNFPNYDAPFFELYIQHLLEGFNDARAIYFQEQIFSSAKKYIDMLPPDDKYLLLHSLLEKIGKTKGIYRFIKLEYAELLDKENTNINPNQTFLY